MSVTFDLDGEHRTNAYQILSSLITPRPIAWVSTLNEDGSVNAAPFSFFNVFGSRPPMIVFAPGNKGPGELKDTARNIKRQKQFVVHMVDQPMLELMNHSAATLPYEIPELSAEHFTASDTIDVPRIAAAPVAMECSEHSCLEIGQNRLIIGLVHTVHVQDGIANPDDAKINQAQYAPIGRMASPNWYCETTSIFQLDRPD
ncbi:flavin reductase family protein [Rubritalea marina]|uniref:flavin reductase family protein n=1 Tax=Rubritalea marina TaxID=361055 RepID=UPI00037B80D4|nr:flavin reductase family protein [Rubritalea marina]